MGFGRKVRSTLSNMSVEQEWCRRNIMMTNKKCLKGTTIEKYKNVPHDNGSHREPMSQEGRFLGVLWSCKLVLYTYILQDTILIRIHSAFVSVSVCVCKICTVGVSSSIFWCSLCLLLWYFFLTSDKSGKRRSHKMISLNSNSITIKLYQSSTQQTITTNTQNDEL